MHIGPLRLNKSLSSLATATALWSFFFAVCIGLGYPTLNRYDPGVRNPDASEYSKMVRSDEGVPTHFRHRVLIPYLARPIFHAATGRVGSWDPAYFALLLVNSWFVSGTAFLLFMVVSRIMGSPNIALLSSAIFLLNFAVPNLLLAGLVDSGEAFFLMALVWALSAEWFFLLPLAAVLGSLAKETFLPFSLVFAATWMVMNRRQKPLGKRVMWLVATGLAGAISLTAVLTATNGYLLFPSTYAGMLRSSLASPATAAAALKDLNFWYVFAWLLPLGLWRLKHLPREWVMASFLTALVALGFTAYHNDAPDAGPAAARPIFNIAGPLLSFSVALLIVDLAERRRALHNEKKMLR
ncbi:MAG TPA: hypothetical protein VN948_23655 [Terriglobales bacterium]|nr:hypothetical protein [Terriglobales bacterium]